jgi:protein gp37
VVVMAENSGIEWTHHTFNPWIGCTKVSAACDNCYAEAWDARGLQGLPTRWGPHAARTRTKTWGNPVRWNREAERLGIRYRVFCASLADVFDNHKTILPEWRADLWALIRATPHLDWLMLTKRPQNIPKMLPPDWGDGYRNVWLGATVESQKEADRLDALISVPAIVHFLSMEPLIGAVDLSRHIHGLQWVITGGENGAHFRPVDPDWFRSLRDQCAAADVPFLFKQWEGRGQKEIKAKGRELDGVVHDGYPATPTGER